MRIFPLIAGVCLIVVSGLALAVALRVPRNDRQWEHAFSRAPLFEATGADRLILRDMRDFEFASAGEPTKAQWLDQPVDANDLVEVWFFIEPFEAWDGAAHSFLSFIFEGETARTISISVEARKEQGETYSGLRGMFNAYELIYQWSTEKDILSRIAVGLGHELYAYRLDIAPEQARAIFDHFVKRTNALHDEPRFYNTLTSNCTNELAKAVNNAFPNVLPWHYSHVLTGHSAKHLHSRAFIKDDRSFEELKARAAIGEIVRRHADAPEETFSSSWRNALLRRTD